MELNGIIYKQSKTYPDIYVSACGKILMGQGVDPRWGWRASLEVEPIDSDVL